MNSNIKRKILHIFFPNRCPVCGEFNDALSSFCDVCSSKIQPYTGRFSIKGASGCTAAFVYNKDISPAVFLLKNGICGNAAYALGGALASKLYEDGIADKVDVIVPVPLHKASRSKRGYNQTELIVKVVGEKLGIRIAAHCAVKVRKTKEQKFLNSYHRRLNLKDAFRIVDPALIKGKRVLIIDDISTTGTTLTELTSLLLKNGAEEVYCAACCHTPAPGTEM